MIGKCLRLGAGPGGRALRARGLSGYNGSIGNSNVISQDLLEMLCCPLSKGKLLFDAERKGFVSVDAQVLYPLLPNGAPNFCPHDAIIINENQVKK
jgi:uncharacterized protein YbaR (Trm112 family)